MPEQIFTQEIKIKCVRSPQSGDDAGHPDVMGAAKYRREITECL